MDQSPLHTEIELSERMFCFYALLNSGGYLPEKQEVHPVRGRVLSFIQERIPKEFTQAIKGFLAEPEVRKEYWFPYRTWILCHGQPPQFSPLSEHWKKFLGDDEGEKLGMTLKTIWSDHGVAELWEQEKIEYQKVEKQCERNALSAVQISMDYLRAGIEEVPLKRFIVIPNFLDEYHRGIGPLIDDTAYALIGPSPDSNDPFPEERIQHEFLHSMINSKVGDTFPSAANSEKSKLREMLIHAIVLRTLTSHQEYTERKRANLLKKGVNIEPLLNIFTRYENTEGSFRKFLNAEAGKIKEACR